MSKDPVNLRREDISVMLSLQGGTYLQRCLEVIHIYVITKCCFCCYPFVEATGRIHIFVSFKTLLDHFLAEIFSQMLVQCMRVVVWMVLYLLDTRRTVIWYFITGGFLFPLWSEVQPSPLLLRWSVERSAECLTGETDVPGENLPHCCLVHHKSRMTLLGLEPGPPRWSPGY
jgi:hypothetical protein